MTTFRTNLGVGVTRGLAIGAFFAAGALVLRLVNGSRFLDDYHVSLLGLIAYDVLAGAATGAIVGSLLPLASRSSIGAALVGFVAMLPASFVGMLIVAPRSEEHTSELQSRSDLVCRLLLEKKKKETISSLTAGGKGGKHCTRDHKLNRSAENKKTPR